MSKIVYDIFCDGSASNKTLIGAYWYCCVDENGEILFEGGNSYENVRSGRMEVEALNDVLETLNTISPEILTDTIFQVRSDSQYVVNTYNKWLSDWIAIGVLKSKANADLWESIHQNRRRDVRVIWVKGHSSSDGLDEQEAYYSKWNNYVDIKARDLFRKKTFEVTGIEQKEAKAVYKKKKS